jgi:hypothetical protein
MFRHPPLTRKAFITRLLNQLRFSPFGLINLLTFELRMPSQRSPAFADSLRFAPPNTYSNDIYQLSDSQIQKAGDLRSNVPHRPVSESLDFLIRLGRAPTPLTDVGNEINMWHN